MDMHLLSQTGLLAVAVLQRISEFHSLGEALQGPPVHS